MTRSAIVVMVNVPALLVIANEPDVAEKSAALAVKALVSLLIVQYSVVPLATPAVTILKVPELPSLMLGVTTAYVIVGVRDVSVIVTEAEVCTIAPAEDPVLIRT